MCEIPFHIIMLVRVKGRVVHPESPGLPFVGKDLEYEGLQEDEEVRRRGGYTN